MARTTRRWRLLSLFLAVLMLVSALPLTAIGAFAAEVGENSAGRASDETADPEVRAVLLDSGRKYFSVANIKKLIKHMADYKYNQLQLVIGNGGCRFLLDDMSLSFKVSDTTTDLDSKTVADGIKAGNKAFDGVETCWTQSDMDEIIAYANEMNIEIVPMLNMPGHATAIAYVNNGAYRSGTDAINVNDATARAYAIALLDKYAKYFGDKGCLTFSFGADESGFTGSNMTDFVTACATTIKNRGMIPRAFNDATNVATFDADTEFTYWNQESGSKAASALATAGYNMINTHGRWYYVVKTKQTGEEGTKYKTVTGTNGAEVSVELPSYKHATNDSEYPATLNNYFDNSRSKITSDKHKGTMFSIWCDNSTGLTEDQIMSETEEYGALYQLAYLATDVAKWDMTQDAPPTGSTGYAKTPTATETVNINLTVGETTTKTYDWQGSLLSGYGSATVATAVAADGSVAASTTVTKATSLTSGSEYLIGDGTNWLTLSNGSLTNTTDKSKATKWTVTKSGSGSYYTAYTIKSGSYYLTHSNNSLGVSESTSNNSWYWSSANGFYYTSWMTAYYLNLSSNNWSLSSSSSATKPGAYTLTETAGKAATTVTFTAKSVGTTTYYLQNADESKTVKFVVTVAAEDLSGATSQEIELWITNTYVGATLSEATATGHIVKVFATDAYGANGVALSGLVPSPAVDSDSRPVGFWKGTVLTSANKQVQGSTDRTDAGEDFQYIRYYDGKWSYLNSQNVWTAIAGDEQVVAYYMQVFKVSPEIEVVTKDYGVVFGNGAGNTKPSQYGCSGYMGVGMAVVYPDKTMSPADDEGIWDETLQCLFVYNNTRSPGIVVVKGIEGFVITKITITHGTGPSGAYASWSEYTDVTWEKDKDDSGEYWYRETTLWTRPEGDTTTRDIQLDEDDWGTTWVSGTSGGDTFLLLIYVEPIKVETNDLLSVVYKDDTAGTIIRDDIQIGVPAENTFLNSLNNNGSTTHTAGTIDLKDDAYILNSAGQSQTFNKKLSQVVPDNATYNSGNYVYAGTDISEDGKTFTLHYVKKNTLSVIYWDDTTDTKITTDVVNFYVVQGTTFLNGLKKDDKTISVTAGVRFDLPDGSCIDAFENAGEEDPNKAECMNITKSLAEVHASGIDVSLYYYVNADVNENGTTLTIHYEKKNALKVVYVDDSNDGAEIVVDTTKVPNPFATTKAGVTFDKDGYNSVSEIDVADFNGNKLVIKDALSDVMTDASAYADHYLYKITVEDDGLTLKLHYKKNTLKVVYWDATNNTEIKTNVENPFAKVEDGETFATSYDLSATITVGGKTVKKELSEVLDNASAYADYYLVSIASEDGLTLTLSYKAKKTLTVVYWEITDATETVITRDDNFAKTKDVTFNDLVTPAYTLTEDGETWTVKTAITDVTADSKYDEYYWVSDRVEVSEDGLTLNLYYRAPIKLTVIYYDTTAGKEIKKDSFSGRAGAEWYIDTDKVYAFDVDGGKKEYTLKLSDVPGLTTPYNIVDLYEYVEKNVSGDGYTLTLYYAPKTVILTIKWIDDSGNISVHTKNEVVLATGNYPFTADLVAALNNGTQNSVSITNVRLRTETYYADIANAVEHNGLSEGYTGGDYYFVKAVRSDDGMILELHYNKYKTLNVVWVDKATNDTIATDTITGAKADAVWNKDTYTITNNGHVAETDLKKLPADSLSDPKYAEQPYKLVKTATKVDGDTLYLYYELQTVTVTVKWWDDNADEQIDSKSYTLDEGKTLADVLSDVTINGLKVTLGTAPALTHNNGTASIEQDLTKLTLAASLAVYQSGIYKYVDADLSEDKMTLTLHYDLNTLDDKSLSYVLDYGLPVKIDDLTALFKEAYGIDGNQIQTISLDGDLQYAYMQWDEENWNSLTYTLNRLMNGTDTIVLTAYVGEAMIEVTLTLKFIPANNIYYEESFFNDPDDNVHNGYYGDQPIEWETVGTTSDLSQSADYVGSKNPYGYDDAYANDLGLSAGSALQVTVPYIPKGATNVQYPTLTFTFTGTGFDIISRTGVDQGRIGVKIEQNGDEVHNYGVILRGDNELYQVPVMSVEGLEHGTYKVTITVYPPMEMVSRESDAKKFLYGTAQGATFVLDGIRIYDPVDTTDEANSEVLEAYKADGQAVVKRQEIRDLLINKGDAITTTVDKGEGGSVADLNGFTNIGPNNELYLAPGQSVSFEITLNAYEVLYLRSHALLGEATGTLTIAIDDVGEFPTDLTWKSGTDWAYLSNMVGGDLAFTVIVTNTSTDITSGWIALTDLVITKPASAFAD